MDIVEFDGISNSVDKMKLVIVVFIWSEATAPHSTWNVLLHFEAIFLADVVEYVAKHDN